MKIAARGLVSRGQALVEFALVAMLFLTILFAVVDFGRAIYAYNTVSNAARQAARLAIVDQAAADVTAKAIDTAPALGLGSGNVHFCVYDQSTASWIASAGHQPTCPGGPQPPSCASPYQIGCSVVVTVTAPWSPITPVIGNVVGPLTLSSTSIETIEYVCPTQDHASCP